MNTVKKIWAIMCLLMVLLFGMIMLMFISEYFEQLEMDKKYGTNDAFATLVGVLIFAVIYSIPTIKFLCFVIWNRCPYCKKFFVLKKVGVQDISKEKISVLVKVKRYDINDKECGTQEQYIPGTRISYEATYLCEKCGKKKYKRWSQDYTNT